MPNSHGNAIPFSGHVEEGNVAGGALQQPALSQRLDVWGVQSSVRLRSRAPQRRLRAAASPRLHIHRPIRTVALAFPIP